MRIILPIILLCLTHVVFAQERNPVRWTTQANKIGDRQYELHFSAFIEPPYHIYSQNNDSDAAVSTNISFDAGSSMELIGKAKEVGDMKMDSVLGTVIRYYEDKVEFVQIIKIKTASKVTVSGKISWMACTTRCLPEAERRFSFTIGDN
jgi:thiol:disulfide interchange protein DsbD